MPGKIVSKPSMTAIQRLEHDLGIGVPHGPDCTLCVPEAPALPAPPPHRCAGRPEKADLGTIWQCGDCDQLWQFYRHDVWGRDEYGRSELDDCVQGWRRVLNLDGDFQVRREAWRRWGATDRGRVCTCHRSVHLFPFLPLHRCHVVETVRAATLAEPYIFADRLGGPWLVG